MSVPGRGKPAAGSRLPATLARLATGLALAHQLALGGAARGQEMLPAPRKAPAPFVLPDPYSLPDPQRLFRLDTEATLRQRMTTDSQLGLNPLGLKYGMQFPEYPSVPKAQAVVRQWAPLTEVVEPPVVCYRRLYFEQLNLERYGWGLGVLSPFVSQGAFYFDLVTLPYRAGMEPLRRYECNAGYALPGDPVPLLLYPLEPSLTGAATEAAVIGLLSVVFP
jgi:hypothetical protein